jgi:DNA-directed RNA polymerase I subunit RPA12
MALVGTLLFCTDCGKLLDRKPPAPKTIVCQVCDVSNTSQVICPAFRFIRLTILVDKWPVSTITESKPGAFPSSLQQKHNSEIQTVDLEAAGAWPVTSESCPKCDNPEMFFREMQLRGADEGTTIFYRCPKCNYMYEHRYT